MKVQMRREIECEKKLVLALQSVSRLRRLSTVPQLLQMHQQSNLKKKVYFYLKLKSNAAVAVVADEPKSVSRVPSVDTSKALVPSSSSIAKLSPGRPPPSKPPSNGVSQLSPRSAVVRPGKTVPEAPEKLVVGSNVADVAEKTSVVDDADVLSSQAVLDKRQALRAKMAERAASNKKLTE